jgi:hypothetical protein
LPAAFDFDFDYERKVMTAEQVKQEELIYLEHYLAEVLTLHQ